MKISFSLLLSYFLVTFVIIVPVNLQDIESRRYRPHTQKCDRHERCSPKEGYIEEVNHRDDEYRADKERPPELTRDDWPIRPKDDYDHKLDTDKDDKGDAYIGGGYKPKPANDKDDDDVKSARPSGGYGGGFLPKLPIDEPPKLPSHVIRPGSGGGGYGGGGYKPDADDIKPSTGGGYNTKPVADRDEIIKPAVNRPGGGSGGYGGSGYKPKPEVDRDEDIKPVVTRPGGGSGGYGGGGYKPKPSIDRDEDLKPVVRPSGDGYGGGYKPKPSIDRDEDLKPVVRPSGDGYGGGYKPKPVNDRDEVIKPSGGRPSGGNRGGGYNSKVDDEDYDIKPVRGGGGYNPDDERNPTKVDLGGYNNAKNDDYNDYGTKGGGSDDYYDGKPLPVVEENCICVPYYQCKDGHIVTDGAGIIDARKRPQPDEELPLDGKFKPPSCGPYHVCCNTPETSTVKPYEHRCGVRNPSGINSRILSPSNKGEADFGEWPWQAAVLKSESDVNIFQCGGVLIDKYHVLTVAHCVFHLYKYNEYPLKVRLGEWDTQTTTEFLAHEDYKVSKIIVHPEYRNTSLWNDVAVLRLQDPVLFAPHIDTVCLPQYDEVFGGQNCVVTGWGKDAYKGGTFSNVMKEVALQVIDNYKCEEMLRKTRLGRFFQLYEGFLCAGGEYGLDSCKGDGGGPLVCYRKDKSYALAGIVSWGIDCGQPGVPGVYVKIQKYLDWISKTTGVTLQEYWPKH